MNSTAITIQNDTDLHHRIMKLSNLKEEQELVIKRNVRELMYSMHPSMIVRNVISKFTGDNESKSDLKSAGLNLGKDFLISKLFGGKGSLKGFFILSAYKKSDRLCHK